MNTPTDAVSTMVSGIVAASTTHLEMPGGKMPYWPMMVVAAKKAM